MPVWSRTHYVTSRDQMRDGMVIAKSLRYVEVDQQMVWQYNSHDLLGWITCPDQTAFIPPFKVRKINLVDESNLIRKVTFDLAGCGDIHKLDTDAARFQFQLGVMEVLETNIGHDRYVTKVYLDATGTNATYIVLLG